jgi:pimeloyl-ACP methyl ester carboxylesterase
MEHEWVEIEVDEDTTLRGLWVPADGPPLLVLPGSGMTIARNTELFGILHDAGYSVLLCDYRGTGWSSGHWMTSRWLDDDARILWDWLRANKGEPAGVMGISIGTVAACGLLDHPHPPAAVILDRPVNPRTVIRRFLGQATKIGGFISLFVVRPSTDVQIDEALEHPNTDVLIVFPEHDVLFPPQDVARLRKHLGPRVRTVTVPGGHMSSHLVDPALWRTTYLDFLDARLRPDQPPRGREVRPDVAKVVRFELDGNKLTIELDRDDLPDKARVMVLGLKKNAFLEVNPVGRVMEFELERKVVRRLDPIFAVRVCAPDEPKPVGVRGSPKVPYRILAK